MQEIYVAVINTRTTITKSPMSVYIMQDYPNMESAENELITWYGKGSFDIYTLDDYIDTYPVNHFTYEGGRCGVFKNNPDGKATIHTIPSFVNRLIISRDVTALNIINGFSVDRVADTNDFTSIFEKEFMHGKKFSGNTLQDAKLNSLDDFISGYKQLDESRDKSIIVAIYYDTPMSVVTASEAKLYNINHISILVTDKVYLITIGDTNMLLSLIGNIRFESKEMQTLK